MNKLFPAVFAIGLLATGAVYAADATTAAPAAGASSTNPISATTPASDAPGNASDANNGTTKAPGGGLTHGDDSTAAAPSNGATIAYTESDARTRFQNDGFTKVGEMSKDNMSNWHGKGLKDGKWVNVALDTHGNVVIE